MSNENVWKILIVSVVDVAYIAGNKIIEPKLVLIEMHIDFSLIKAVCYL